MSDKPNVPVKHAGEIVTLGRSRFRVVTASSMSEAKSAAVMAGVTGSVGASSYTHGIASEQRPVEAWAIVERIDEHGNAVKPYGVK